MAIGEAEIEEAYIAQSRALLITGTHFSTRVHQRHQQPRARSRARRNDVRTVLDIDYRPVLWGLTKRGDGETRYIASDTVTAHLQKILPQFDLVIGTIEEFNIAGGSDDIMRSLARGARVHRAPCSSSSAGRWAARSSTARSRARSTTRSTARGVHVDVLNVLGAGDAFSSGLPVGLGARRGLRRVRALCQRLRRARRVAPRLRAGDADARRARLFHRQRRSGFRVPTRTRR